MLAGWQMTVRWKALIQTTPALLGAMWLTRENLKSDWSDYKKCQNPWPTSCWLNKLTNVMNHIQLNIQKYRLLFQLYFISQSYVWNCQAFWSDDFFQIRCGILSQWHQSVLVFTSFYLTITWSLFDLWRLTWYDCCLIETIIYYLVLSLHNV